LDEPWSGGLRTFFNRLSAAGLIYPAARLVNWSPVLETAISVLEF
jgi:valyl-tRNA synthetase